MGRDSSTLLILKQSVPHHSPRAIGLGKRSEQIVNAPVAEALTFNFRSRSNQTSISSSVHINPNMELISYHDHLISIHRFNILRPEKHRQERIHPLPKPHLVTKPIFLRFKTL
jgi:hypothetical protein